MTQTLVIGIGNDCRGDDAVGLAVADVLATHTHPELRVIRHNGSAINAIDRFDSEMNLIVVDAVHADDQAGHIICLDVSREHLHDLEFGVSSHGFTLAGVLELAKTLDRLPDHVTVVGVVGRCFEIGAPMSQAVSDAVPQVVENILSYVTHAALEPV